MTGTCIVCGASFEIPKMAHKMRFCSRKCWRFEHGLHRPTGAMRRDLADKAKAAAEMRARLAARDAEYAAVGVAVAVEVRGNLRTETRGQRCIGAHAASFVRHS